MSRNKISMKDVSRKSVTKRTATAMAVVTLSRTAFGVLVTTGSPKGDVFETARLAGIMAAKATPQMIPLCHPLLLEQVAVEFALRSKDFSVEVYAKVKCHGRTGVEMEALHAAAVSSLTIYDMMKWCDKGAVISELKLLEKSGGKSGNFKRE